MAVLTVGLGQQFQTISAAIAASSDGDTINVMAGTYTNDTATIDKSITLQAVGGAVNLVETQALPNEKGIFIVGDSNAPNVTVNGFTFSGAETPDGDNGAGIRYQAGNLTLNGDTFINNQDGILATPLVAATGSIIINNSEFGFNGAGDGFSHNMYIGDVSQFTLNNSYTHDASVGHEIKSRAENNTITNNIIADNNSTSSYSIDLPNGGNATISGNTIEQGPNGGNPVLIAYGEEGNLHTGTDLSISNNTFVNDLTAHAPTAVWNDDGNASATLSNDSFWGITASQVVSGANTQTDDVFLTSRPTINEPGSPLITIESFGVTSLALVDGNYVMDPVAGGTGPEVSYQGTPVTVGEFGAWTPLGAEATSTGYEVAWQNGSADQYTVWQTDSSGNYVSGIGTVSGSSSTFEAYETSFHQDLNGDGTIGVPGATGTAIESFGSTSLVQSGGNYFMNPVAGGTGPEVSYQGTPVTAGEFGAWTPLGAEATSTGYEVAWKNGSADQYTVWQTDSSGNYLSDSGSVSGMSATLETAETSFHQDLNHDGMVGMPGVAGTTIESSGATSLVQSGSQYFMNPVAGGTGPEVSYQGTPVTVGEFGAWTPLGAEATSAGYEVAWKNGSADQYTVWQTDSSGNYLSDSGFVTGTSATLETAETSFHQDLNGDGMVGMPGVAGTTIESSGATSLVQSGSQYFMNPVAGGTDPEVSYQGTPVTAGEFGAWTPLGAEATSTGYEVAWKNGSADQYTIWQTDSSGNYLSDSGFVSGTSATLETAETSFHQDLNGDGSVGVPGGGTAIAAMQAEPPMATPVTEEATLIGLASLPHNDHG